MIDTTKLPKWAQDYIKTLQRERQAAVDSLNQYLDNQSPSSFFILDLVSTGEKVGPSFKQRFIQTHNMEVVHDGVYLRIVLRKGQIDLQWRDADEHHREVALIPSSYMSARLVSKENMS